MSFAFLFLLISTTNFSLLWLLSGSICFIIRRFCFNFYKKEVHFLNYKNQMDRLYEQKLSKFAKIPEQRLVLNLRNENHPPNLVKQTTLFDKAQLFKKLSGQSTQSIQMAPPSTRQQIRTTRDLKNSNLSIINRFFSESSPQRFVENSEETLRKALQMKDVELEFFRTELEKLRSGTEKSENFQQKLEAHRKREQELERERQILIHRMTKIEQQFQQFQSQFGGSNINLSLSSSSQRIEWQNEVEVILRRETQLTNQIEYYQSKVFQLQKKLEESNQIGAEFEEYRSQVLLEITILTNLNHALSQQNDRLKQNAQDLKQQLQQTRSEMTQPQVRCDKQSAITLNEFQILKQELEQKTIKLTLSENQLLAFKNAKTAFEIDKSNEITRLQKELKQAKISLDFYNKQILIIDQIKKENIEMKNKLKQKGLKERRFIRCQNQSKSSIKDQQRLLKIARQLQQVRGILNQKQSIIDSLRKQLEKINSQNKASEKDFTEISSSTQLIKAHITISNLTKNLEELQHRNRLLEQKNKIDFQEYQKEVSCFKNRNQQIQYLTNIIKQLNIQIANSEHQLKQKNTSNYEKEAETKARQLQNAQMQIERNQIKINQLQQHLKDKNQYKLVNANKEADHHQSAKILESQKTALIQKVSQLQQDVNKLHDHIKTILQNSKTIQQKLQFQNKKMSFQRNHLIYQMQEVIQRLKTIQDHSNNLTSILQESESQIDRLKNQNSKLKIRLEKEITDNQVMHNKLRTVIDQSNFNLDKTKQERLEIYNKMNRVMDTA